jgi:hypothetical protein
MNLNKAFYTFLTLALTIQLGFAQVKEEAFYTVQPDPIKSIQVYPNPATEFVSIKFETPQAKKVKLTVHNILGNALDLETETVDEYEIKVRVKDLSSGYYFVSVSDASINSKSTFKFLKR